MADNIYEMFTEYDDVVSVDDVSKCCISVRLQSMTC